MHTDKTKPTFCFGLICVDPCSSVAHPLETDLQPKAEGPLHNTIAAGVRGAGHLEDAAGEAARRVKAQARDVRRRIAQLRRVERVQRFRTELGVDPLCDPECAEET